MTIKLAINGFGRIERLVYRVLCESNADVEIIAINDLVPADNLTYLLKHDSVHKKPDLHISSQGDFIHVNGKKTKVIAERDPSKLPWKEMNVDYVIESTGLFTQKEDAYKHIQAGAKKVIITAPAKGDVPTFVIGVNSHKIQSALAFNYFKCIMYY
jgi:glyceraldehyde 3-phosphate dehydrogenase